MYWTALFLGFVGSLHCVVMCGPIALAMSGQQTLSKFLLSRLLYNLGRITTYATIGLLFGLLGELILLGSYQQVFSVALGLLMIALAILLGSGNQSTVVRPMYQLTQKLKSGMVGWLKTTTLSGSFLLGMLNGFLPCGLVYAAVAGALATADLVNGLGYMVVFGLGTFPAMFVMALSGRALKGLSYTTLNKISTVFVLVLGGLLVIRGLDLNIPYLSPAISLLYPTADITVCD